MDNTLLDLSFIKESGTPEEAMEIIKAKIDVEFDEIKVGEKTSIQTSDHNAYYLPSMKTIFDFLGLKLDLVSIMEQSELAGIEPLQISRSSKYDLQGKGVGKNTYKKYLDWAFDNFIPHLTNAFSDTNSLFNSMNSAPSNGSDWKLACIIFKKLLEDDNFSLRMTQFVPLAEFIEYRCDTELALQQSIRERDDFETLKHADISIWWLQFIKPFFAEHTVQTSEMLSRIDDVFIDKLVPSELTEAEKHAFYINFLRMEYDFILSAIAHYEAGYVITYCSDEQAMRKGKPLLNQAIYNYATSNESRTCFYFLLNELKERMAKLGHSINWKNIASNIPVHSHSDDSATGVTLEEKQLDRLKKWRKGKDLPSSELLEQFVANFCCDIFTQDEERNLLFNCRIAMGLDKLAINTSNHLENAFGANDCVKQAWRNTLSHYHQDYYLHYLEQHIKRASQQ